MAGANNQPVELLEIAGRVVEVDAEIADLVRVLNANGFETVASCSGHGERPGNIALRDGRELIIARDWDEARKIEQARVLAMEYAADRLGDEPSDGSANCPRFSIAVEALRNIRTDYASGCLTLHTAEEIAAEALAEISDMLSGRETYDTRLIELIRTRVAGGSGSGQ